MLLVLEKDQDHFPKFVLHVEEVELETKAQILVTMVADILVQLDLAMEIAHFMVQITVHLHTGIQTLVAAPSILITPTSVLTMEKAHGITLQVHTILHQLDHSTHHNMTHITQQTVAHGTQQVQIHGTQQVLIHGTLLPVILITQLLQVHGILLNLPGTILVNMETQISILSTQVIIIILVQPCHLPLLHFLTIKP